MRNKKNEPDLEMELPSDMEVTVKKLASLSDRSESEVLEHLVMLGLPLYEQMFLCRSMIPLRRATVSSEEYARELQEYMDAHPYVDANECEPEILVAYIRFLEAFDGSPSRFFYRHPGTGRVIASHKTIEIFRQRFSSVFASLQQDLAFAEEQWSARWKHHLEQTATGQKRGDFSALKFVLENEHGHRGGVDMDALASLLGAARETLPLSAPEHSQKPSELQQPSPANKDRNQASRAKDLGEKPRGKPCKGRPRH